MRGFRGLFGALVALVGLMGLIMVARPSMAQTWYGVTVYTPITAWAQSPLSGDKITFDVDFWWYPNSSTGGGDGHNTAGIGTITATSVDINYYNSGGTVINTVNGIAISYATGTYGLSDTSGNWYDGVTLLQDSSNHKTDVEIKVSITSYSGGIGAWVSSKWYMHSWDHAVLTYHWNWETKLQFSLGTTQDYKSGDLTYNTTVHPTD